MIAGQLRRFVFIGIVNNAGAYLVYLLLTFATTPPKLAMTLVYVAAATMGYMCNRVITFSFSGRILGSGFRYVLAHAGGYTINFVLLTVLVDMRGYSHQLVQAASIPVVAGFMFIALKFFVFRRNWNTTGRN